MLLVGDEGLEFEEPLPVDVAVAAADGAEPEEDDDATRVAILR